MLFPAVKDAVNNLLALQQEKGMVPRGSKLLADAELVSVMEVWECWRNDEQTLKYVITCRLQEITGDSGFAALWLNVRERGVSDPIVLQPRGPDSWRRPAERGPVRVRRADGAESGEDAERSRLLLGRKSSDDAN